MLKKSKYKDFHIHFFLIVAIAFISITLIGGCDGINFSLSGENLPKYNPKCCVVKDFNTANELGCVQSIFVKESQTICSSYFYEGGLGNIPVNGIGNIELTSGNCNDIPECAVPNCIGVSNLADGTAYPFYLTNGEYTCGLDILYKCQNGKVEIIKNCGLRGGTCNLETQNCDGETFPVNAASFVVYENSTSTSKKVIILKNLLTSSIKQITSEQHYSLFPAVNGNIIAWQDQRNGDSGTYRYDIYAYDLSIDQERRITSNSYALNYPFVYDNKIIWNDYRNALYPASVGDVYMCDITPGSTNECGTNNDRRITMFSTINKIPQSFKDNKITWQSNYKVYMCDITPGSTYECGIAEKLITDNGLFGDVYGNIVVYQGGDNRNYIYYYDLDSGTATRLAPDGTMAQMYPRISGSKAVWQDGRNGNNDIYMYNFDTSTETRITSSNCHEDSPDIYGNTIVWHKKSCAGDVNWGIRMCDLTPGSACECGITSCEVMLTTYGDYLTNPATG
ncbi:MAG: hypothetical protein WC413_01065 [Candidatus Nanoarchaeia archaeon]